MRSIVLSSHHKKERAEDARRRWIKHQRWWDLICQKRWDCGPIQPPAEEVFRVQEADSGRNRYLLVFDDPTVW